MLAMPSAIQLPPPSPCIGVCQMQTVHTDGGQALCAGCWRNIDEIANWSGLDTAAKLAVWQQIDERKAKLANAV